MPINTYNSLPISSHLPPSQTPLQEFSLSKKLSPKQWKSNP